MPSYATMDMVTVVIIAAFCFFAGIGATLASSQIPSVKLRRKVKALRKLREVEAATVLLENRAISDKKSADDNERMVELIVQNLFLVRENLMKEGYCRSYIEKKFYKAVQDEYRAVFGDSLIDVVLRKMRLPHSLPFRYLVYTWFSKD